MSHGFIDAIEDGRAMGWAVGNDGEAVVVELLVDGRPVAETLAREPRESLVPAGYGDGRRGWTLALPDPMRVKPPSSISARVKSDGAILTNNAAAAWLRHLEVFRNSTIRGLPEVECGRVSRHPDAVDEEIAREIIAAYPAIGSYQSAPGSMWDIKETRGNRTLGGLVERGDASALAGFLVSLPSQPESDGFLNASKSVEVANRRSPLIKDRLLALAQFLGIERVESPEVGPYGAALHLDQRALAERLEHALGFRLTPPTVFDGLFGLRLSDWRILNSRDIEAAYAALRLVEVAGSGDLCEIGGGVGKAAYFAMVLGCRSYTLIDLPMMCVFQYFYLRRSLPDRTVAIVTPSQRELADINIVPASAVDTLPPEWRFDGILNADSFPEMGHDICQGYFDFAAARAPLLLSINHEGNAPLAAGPDGLRHAVVSEMMARRTDFKRSSRTPSWIRKGFVDEVYRVDATRSKLRDR